MLVQGKAIAEEIGDALHDRVRRRSAPCSLGVIVVEETPEIHTFVALKKKFGENIGIKVEVLQLDPLHKDTQGLLQLLLHASRDHDALILQLPLPPKMDFESVMQLFPLSHDVDVIGNIAYTQFKEKKLPYAPPVVGAFAEVLRRHNVLLAGKRVLVLGEGHLVGAPSAIWATQHGATVMTVHKETGNIKDWLRGADVILCGAGSPGLVTPDSIREGVIILDAGTSEQGGVLKGDADPACAEKASIFTPTPGGIGPITVAKVFENLLALVELKERRKR
jgi:methylenetetrahydrofolate dehydrogenase (NADP+)/methenyltetrahydrofolate cyclohydrolase